MATEAFPSSGYATFRRRPPWDGPAPRLPEAVRERPERMREERFAKLAAKDDPSGTVNEAQSVAIIADGVDAFLRACR
ncbi:hypothetical protein DP939_06180 [Spongiactinospora rosea]|uniref:Uncharacterized protein n=1 Tax=Spongiactinospora rosea TaxID=2248750 RepID=A0A366M536_9ACTN|nr:hypothetical protein [Spongiactinospora rosea]RBQ20669.1 hypothetical protein DP939_06180 [Spongiactinospora rosea]